RLLFRNNVCQFEERRLKDCVDTSAKTDLFSDLDTVDYIELNVVLCHKSLHLAGKMLFKSFHIPGAVQQECTAVYQFLNHIVLAYIGRIVAGHKVSLVNQVCRLNRQLTETKVR